MLTRKLTRSRCIPNIILITINTKASAADEAIVSSLQQIEQ